MKITVLGAGSWGVCLANLLASKDFNVVLWGRNAGLLKEIGQSGCHPKLGPLPYAAKLQQESDLGRALDGAELIVEAVTSRGLRPVFGAAVALGLPECPIVITSKGIEQGTGLLLPEILVDVLGEPWRRWIGCLSGPSHAEEVLRELPTSVVGSAYDSASMLQISQAFTTDRFRVYPNSDLNGVAFGGAMKNPMAIACGICDGIGLGDNTKAALMTRGLHEMRKLSVVKNCRSDTLNGLSGMGDLCVTCMSTHSRNYRYGRLLGEGATDQEAQEKIGMVVEGVYTCISALELGQAANIELPITEGIHAVIYKDKRPQDIVTALMNRAIKDESL